MSLRGPILIVFAASLIMSPLVIGKSSNHKIRLSTGKVTDCTAFGVNSVGGRSGCPATNWGR